MLGARTHGGHIQDVLALPAPARRTVVAGLAVTLAVALMGSSIDAAPKTRRVSVRTGGGQAVDASRHGSVSANGRFIAFASVAPNLVNGDANGAEDVFVHDREKRKTKLVSKHSNGTKGDAGSRQPSISANGRYVAFTSDATNLWKVDFNDGSDVFVRDRKTGKTRQVSIRTLPGNQVIFDRDSSDPDISADGRFVVFASAKPWLVNGDDNDATDVFIHDRKKDRTRLISKSLDGTVGNGTSKHPRISDDGRFVVFESFADDLIVGDTNGDEDVYLYDRKKKKMRRVSVTSSGGQRSGESDDPHISGNGRFIGFESHAPLSGADGNGLRDIYVHDRVKGKTKLVSKASNGTLSDAASGDAYLSANGRWIVFESDATNLVKNPPPPVTQGYLRDRKTKKTRLIVKRNGGGAPTADVGGVELSADGRFVVAATADEKMVGSDTNGVTDIFRRGPIR